MPVVSLQTSFSTITREESSTILHHTQLMISTMIFQLLVMVSKTARNTGLLETHGVQLMVNKDSSESSEVPTTSRLKPIALGEYHLTLGLKTLDIILQKKKRKTLENQLLITLMLKKKNNSWKRKSQDMEDTPKEEARLTFNHPKLLLMTTFCQVLKCLQIGIGETRMVSTTFHGSKINISQFTVDHAGHKQQLLHLLIDLTLCSD